MISRSLVASLCSVVFFHSVDAEETLPLGPNPEAIVYEHFPSPLHAVVWRNWNLVPLERLEATVGAPAGELGKIARSMGLPESRPVPDAFDESLYITVLRRNWHLLPYDQLLTLLDRSAEELAFSLKEDDFLFHKLGNLKPKCEPVRFREVTEEEAKKATRIGEIVAKEFPDGTVGREEPLSFIEDLSRPHEGTPKAAPEKSEGLRYLYSYFGVFGDPLLDPESDPFPAGLLQRLSEQGVNGVWLHVVLNQLVPENGAFPEFGEGSVQRLARLRELVEQAAEYGVDIYLYMNEPRAMSEGFFKDRTEIQGGESRDQVAMCTSTKQVRDWLRDSLAHVFKEVPDLGGVFTITASENFTNCVSKGKETACPRCSKRDYAEIIAEVNRTIAEGVHSSAPDAKVIVWDWGWNGHGDGTDIIKKLPEDVWFQSVSEWAQPFSRGGYDGKVGEYSISVVGPGPRALSHWKAARERGLPTVAKVQFNNTWEMSAVPWLPVMDLIAEHASNLAEQRVENFMLSWSLGGYPSPNLEIAQAFARDPSAKASDVLDQLVEKRYGKPAAGDIRRAWTAFSEAFREFPYSGGTLYLAPQQYGPSNLLYRTDTGYASAMVGMPYDDLKRWRGGYTPDAFAGQFEKLSTGWKKGLEIWDRAAEKIAPEFAERAKDDRGLAGAVYLHFASVANQCRFILARDAMADGQWSVTPEIRKILDSEVEIAKTLHQLQSADSRIGFEASNQYYYLPRDLVEKVIQCRLMGDE